VTRVWQHKLLKLTRLTVLTVAKVQAMALSAYSDSESRFDQRSNVKYQLRLDKAH
jgi:hypothetical protein